MKQQKIRITYENYTCALTGSPNNYIVTHQNNCTTRTRVVQHKCLPHLACINPTPLLF